MRYRSIITSLLGIAVFCGYLMTACNEEAASGDHAAAAPALLITKTDASRAGLPSLAARVAPVPPPAPVAAPVPDPLPLPSPRTEAKYHEAWAIVTAYCPCRRCCGSHADGRTSTGTSAWLKGAAADPAAVAYGTRIYVEGYGYAVVDDTGGAMRRTYRRSGMIHIDLRMTYHHEARSWGRKTMKIRIYDQP